MNMNEENQNSDNETVVVDDRRKARLVLLSEAAMVAACMLVFFGFTHCPDICPAELQVMAAALDGLGPDAEPVRLDVSWPDGVMQRIENVDVDSLVRVEHSVR